MKIRAWLPDFRASCFYPGELELKGRHIISIRRLELDTNEENETIDWPYALPPLVDAHVHIESSMLVPQRFAEAAVKHGTVAVVADPHEIANVAGLNGCGFMQENGEQSSLKIFYTAPSCVPATSLESSGAELRAIDLEELQEFMPWVALGEMMNYPGVLMRDAEVFDKLNLAKKLGKPIDGHAPGLSGDDLQAYIQAGISTDHEATSIKEAEEKLLAGMKILIREGSAAKNFDTLCPLIDRYPEQIMLCSDDLHPDDLIKGHLNLLLKRGVAAGLDVFNLIRAVSINPIRHYQLPLGLLATGDVADFVLVKDLKEFEVEAVFIEGNSMSDQSDKDLVYQSKTKMFQVSAQEIVQSDLSYRGVSGNYRIIVPQDGSLLTTEEIVYLHSYKGELRADPQNNLLKLVVVNRYHKRKPAIAWIRNFGLQTGALASSIAHDSHNIIAVGANDEDLVQAIQSVIGAGGGIAAVDQQNCEILELPIAGLMSTQPAAQVALAYERLNEKARNMGSNLVAPFMTLSFMALLVIPSLKLGDQGLFDGNQFKFVDPFAGP